MGRKSLVNKIEEHKADLDGHGVYIDELNCFIYRLAVAPDGWCRVCQNHFNIPQNTVLGQARSVFDYETPAEAITVFENLKIMPGVVWREDDRVDYSRDDYWNGVKRWKDGKNRFALYLNGTEACVMRYRENNEYYIMTQFGNGISDGVINADSIDAAKKAAEKWLADSFKAEINMHNDCIHKLKMKTLILETKG